MFSLQNHIARTQLDRHRNRYPNSAWLEQLDSPARQVLRYGCRRDTNPVGGLDYHRHRNADSHRIPTPWTARSYDPSIPDVDFRGDWGALPNHSGGQWDPDTYQSQLYAEPSSVPIFNRLKPYTSRLSTRHGNASRPPWAQSAFENRFEDGIFRSPDRQHIGPLRRHWPSSPPRPISPPMASSPLSGCPVNYVGPQHHEKPPDSVYNGNFPGNFTGDSIHAHLAQISDELLMLSRAVARRDLLRASDDSWLDIGWQETRPEGQRLRGGSSSPYNAASSSQYDMGGAVDDHFDDLKEYDLSGADIRTVRGNDKHTRRAPSRAPSWDSLSKTEKREILDLALSEDNTTFDQAEQRSRQLLREINIAPNVPQVVASEPASAI